MLGGLADCQPGANADPAPEVPSSPRMPTTPPVPEETLVPGWTRHGGSNYAVWGTAKDDVWAGGVGLSHFDGRSWTPVPSPTSFCIRGLSGSSSRDIWAVATDGRPILQDSALTNSKKSEILHWDGTAWSRVLSIEGELTAITASGANDAWAVGHKMPSGSGTVGFIMRWDGTTWQEHPYRLQHIPTALWGRASNDVWMVSTYVVSGPYTDRIQHWDGTTWRGAVTPTSTDWQCGVWSSGPDDVWTQGRFRGWHWDGTAWSQTGPLLKMTTSTACAIWGSGPNDVWMGGAETLLHWDGKTFKQDALSPGYTSSIWGSGPKDVWLAAAGGLYHYYQP